MKNFIDFLYTLAIGAAVAVFVGMGIWAFYSEPKYPTYPDYSSAPIMPIDNSQDPTYQAKLDKYNQEVKKYDDTQKHYDKIVAAVALTAGLIFYVAGLLVIKKIDNVGEGFALGGIFTNVYAAIRGGMANSKQLVFGVVTLLLLMFILLAIYRRRIHHATS